MLSKIAHWIDRLSNWGAYLSALILIAIIILIVSNIILMSFFNSSIMITDEYSAYMFAAFTMFSLSYTLKENAHIKITVLSSKLPEKAQRTLRLIVITVAFAMSVFATYNAAFMVYQAFVYKMRADTVAQTLLWIPQLVMPIGFFMLSLQLIGEFIKTAKGEKI